MSNTSPNNPGSEQDMVISYLAIRKAIGYLGASFSIVLALGTLLIGNCHCLKDSVSGYYYTVMNSYFSGTLCVLALFLFSYKGYNKIDQLLTTAGAVFALGTVFLPTNVSVTCPCCNMFTRNNNTFLNVAHYLSSGLFFITMACISLFLFTKTNPDEQPTKQKLQRNKVYKTCAYIMFVAMALIPCLKIPGLPKALFTYRAEFWFESTVLIAFGISWLTKGEAILKDK